MKIIRPQNPDERFFHLHAHSNYSINDALGPVNQMVSTASSNSQPGLALTDHGNMGGAVQLYTHAAKAGIRPFPGLEAYVVVTREDKKAKRHHLGLVSYTTQGYINLARISSQSHSRENFHHKPILDFVDFAELHERGALEGVAATSGCFFGFVQQALASGNMPRARQLCKMFSSWFDPFFIEVQHHHIEDDDHSDEMLVKQLFALAHDMGIPTVITQDAHYCKASDLMTHRALKQLVSWGPDPDDAVFPGDSFHLASTRWVKEHYTDEQWEQGMEGLAWLTEHHDLTIPELESYSYNVPSTVDNPSRQLKSFVLKEMESRGLTGDHHYLERFDDEFDVIEASGMAGYLWLVKEVCDWCRQNDVLYQTRGSASGSLVCWMLGITQLDPLKWKLRFERFLSKDRTKPPDIDLDVEDERRDDLIAMLSRRFAVCQIGTYGTYSVDETSGRGSLLVSYISKQRKLGANVDHIQGLHDIPMEDQRRMMNLSEYKVKKSAGTHAAGLVITTDHDGMKMVPTMLIPSSGTTVTQFTGDDVEALGLMKLDILGLTNLSTIRRACQMLDKPIEPDEWVPNKDAKSFTMLRKGGTTGVFQLDGWTAQRGCKEMRVKSVDQIIALMALYRPAVMNTGGKDTYIRRMSGHEAVPQFTPLLDNILKETYGLFVFQEQVISLLREIGFDPEDLTKFLKAVKASNKNIGDAGDVISHYKVQYAEMAVDAGLTDDEIQWVWTAIEGFAEYGFNRAHATRYGIRAYQGAYLKCNHPMEFYTALLQTSKGDKEREVMKVVTGEGIKLLRPDVNVSTVEWTLDRKAGGIRQGLTTIKGVGVKAAAELVANAPYSSVMDLAQRCDPRAVTGAKAYRDKQEFKGVLDKLNKVGALKSVKVTDPFEGT